MQPRIVRRSVEMPDAPPAEQPSRQANVYSLGDLAHIRPPLSHSQPADQRLDAQWEHTQAEPLATSKLAASPLAPSALTAPEARAQTDPEPTGYMTVRTEHSQAESLAANPLVPAVLTTREEHAQDQSLATSNLAPSALTEHEARAQDESLATSSVTAHRGHTQDEPLATSEPAASALPAPEARAQDEPQAPGALTAHAEHTQDESRTRTRTRARASVLSGTDLPSSGTIPKQGGSTETDSTGGTDARAKGPRPPVLDRVNVPAGYEELAVQLADLRPQGMNYEGIDECMKQPELTRAWTEHALTTKEQIRNLPAYIRAGVRSGKLPVTDAEKEALQAERKPNQAARAATDYGWDDPALKDWDVMDIFRKPGPSTGTDKYGWDRPDETTLDPYGGPYVQ